MDTSSGNNRYLWGKPTPRTKTRSRARPPELRPSFERARTEGSVDLEVALLAERRARGRDGQRMRSPQLARCSRDQTRLRMAALARD